MENRNFNITVISICIIITCIWLSAFNYVRLGIDPVDYIQTSYKSIILGEELEDDEEILIITGKVKEELRLSLSEIKSSKYQQVKNEKFIIVTQVEPHEYRYSGATLWSILKTEDILESGESKFTFIGSDGYESPKPLSLEDVAKDNEKEVIIAYEINRKPIQEGPLRSVINHSAIPSGEYSSQYSVKYLREIRIE
jgi:DMSO/TMAO reductase YedYZ molybdopterin-dependent catalytic subunit